MARILVIDDDELFRAMLQQLLENEGHEVLTAKDGVEGVKRFSENGVDVVVTDIIMPERGGLETIMALRKNHPDIRIIAVSGGGRVVKANFLTMAKSLGALCVLQKPFERRQILQAVEEALA